MLTTRSQQKRHPCEPIMTNDGSNKKIKRNEISRDVDGSNEPKTLNANTSKSSVDDPGTSSESDSEQASEQSDEDSFDGMGVLDNKRNDALDLVAAVQKDDDTGGVRTDENEGQVERIAEAGRIDCCKGILRGGFEGAGKRCGRNDYACYCV